jgi:hypothetical protein
MVLSLLWLLLFIIRACVFVCVCVCVCVCVFVCVCVCVCVCVYTEKNRWKTMCYGVLVPTVIYSDRGTGHDKEI